MSLLWTCMCSIGACSLRNRSFGIMSLYICATSPAFTPPSPCQPAFTPMLQPVGPCQMDDRRLPCVQVQPHSHLPVSCTTPFFLLRSANPLQCTAMLLRRSLLWCCEAHRFDEAAL